MKSDTCFGKQSGEPLTVYFSLIDAEVNAEHLKFVHDKEMVPYECPRCGNWHLSPAERQTPSTSCPVCTGGDGRSKESYQTEQQALRRAEILYDERGISLQVYECEYGHGWHLTKG